MRRPKGKNFALKFSPALKGFESSNLRNEFFRPIIGTNAWVASLADESPTLTLMWNEIQKINKIRLFFDTDADHAMENVQMGHYDSAIPFSIKEYKILDDKDDVVYLKTDNHQTINNIFFSQSIITKELKIQLQHPSKLTPAALFGIIIE
jgi:hypothetical protein